jgi:pimeloyl-ACP methyl ester carboxylesterase
LERERFRALAAGYRAISYDRRGFGRSSQPTVLDSASSIIRDEKARPAASFVP